MIHLDTSEMNTLCDRFSPDIKKKKEEEKEKRNTRDDEFRVWNKINEVTYLSVATLINARHRPARS